MKYFKFVLLFCLYGNIYAQNVSVSSINNELIENANVVIRNASTKFEVINVGKAIETTSIELTILNDNGKREAVQYLYYSNLEKILSFNGELFDKHGNRIKKIKKDDVKDISATGGSNMYTDNRVKVIDFSNPTYPYSLHFEYIIEHNGLMFYPYWVPQDNTSTSVEKASLSVILPASLGLNFHESKVNHTFRKENGSDIYVWEINKLPGIIAEPYSPPLREIVPYVMLTPAKFEIAGYNGSMSSWQSVGMFKYDLVKNRDQLPSEAIEAIKKETKGLTDKREIAKRVYEYVQNTTRYVSVQLDIGGWQPYDATYVYENGYGDCKALTNYTHALLKQVGVNSIYTNIYAGSGEPDIITSFPNSRFNHVFLALPFEKDTVWLECTSQKDPFGYLGYFTSDRHALMITEEGGKLVKTRAYSKSENKQVRTMKVDIEVSGKAIANIKTEYAGLQYENVEQQLYRDKEEQRKWLLQNLDVKHTNITNFSYENHPAEVPKIIETVDLVSTGFGSVTGNRIFFEANPLNQLTRIPKNIKERKTEVYLRTAFSDIDSIEYKIPEGYYLEYIPNNTHIINQFGEYQTNYKQTKDGILFTRKLVREKGIFPAASYQEFRNMLIDISKSDREKIVLVGST